MKNAAAMQVVKAGNRDLMQEKKGEENESENVRKEKDGCVAVASGTGYAVYG